MTTDEKTPDPVAGDIAGASGTPDAIEATSIRHNDPALDPALAARRHLEAEPIIEGARPQVLADHLEPQRLDGVTGNGVGGSGGRAGTERPGPLGPGGERVADRPRERGYRAQRLVVDRKITPRHF